MTGEITGSARSLEPDAAEDGDAAGALEPQAIRVDLGGHWLVLIQLQATVLEAPAPRQRLELGIRSAEHERGARVRAIGGEVVVDLEDRGRGFAFDRLRLPAAREEIARRGGPLRREFFDGRRSRTLVDHRGCDAR